VSNADSFFADVSDPFRYRSAIQRFDELNAADPNLEVVDGKEWPREWLQARRLSDWVMQLESQPSEALRLASRCQHLCRWMIPRDTYALTRAGYHEWRNELKRFHAARSSEVLRAVAYDDQMIQLVQDLNLKKHFPMSTESRILEDALCLVFLQFQLAELAGRTDEEKMVNALRKAWKKMTPAAHEHAFQVPYGARERALVERALAGEEG
jgi:hypothetical protein